MPLMLTTTGSPVSSCSALAMQASISTKDTFFKGEDDMETHPKGSWGDCVTVFLAVAKTFGREFDLHGMKEYFTAIGCKETHKLAAALRKWMAEETRFPAPVEIARLIAQADQEPEAKQVIQ